MNFTFPGTASINATQFCFGNRTAQSCFNPVLQYRYCTFGELTKFCSDGQNKLKSIMPRFYNILNSATG